MDKLKIELPIIVEGKYDKIKVMSIADACVIQTDGFGVFKNSERLALIRQLSKKSRIIVLTDPDGAGKIIRAHITSAIPKDRLIQLYIPQVDGKEKRKLAPSCEGYLGVEGTDADILRRLLEPFSVGAATYAQTRQEITKADFFFVGLSGKNDSSAVRDKLAQRLGLPKSMTANALLAAVNVLMDKERFYAVMKEL